MRSVNEKNFGISIVIPAYNEEGSLDAVVYDTYKNIETYFKDFEIIIVDDGSTDSTGQIADTLSKRYQHLKVIHQQNGGYSKAMLSGINAATKEFTAYLPADGQFLVNDMRFCFEVMPGNDLVLGYRGGRLDYTTKRMFFSYGYLLLLVLLFNIKFSDVGWVNIWRTKKVQSLKINNTEGIFILTEIVVKFMNRNFKIVEAPSFYHPRLNGQVKNAKIKVVLNTLISAIKLKIELLTGSFSSNSSCPM